MTAQFLDGRVVQQRLFTEAARTASEAGVTPGVALVMVTGDDPLVGVNFRLHRRLMEEVGFTVRGTVLPRDTSQEALAAVVREHNEDDDIDAVMVLIPLPEHLDIRAVLASIDPEKEAEGLHPYHAARLSPLSAQPPSRPPVVPNTLPPLLEQIGYDMAGKNIVIVTDLTITEQNPIAKAVTRIAALTVFPPEAAVATVPITHPRVVELARAADLLVVSIKEPRAVTAEFVRPGAVVVDFNAILEGFVPHPDDPERTVPKLCGGVDVESVAPVAGAVAAVPGGVGPAMLGTLVLQIAGMAVARAGKRGTDRVAVTS
jgi:methylenetetrahydrofolate dehydrogenase (NADP+)/methenyltetrahydrofolate cyclohydrolase